jgi:hypothetical protein
MGGRRLLLHQALRSPRAASLLLCAPLRPFLSPVLSLPRGSPFLSRRRRLGERRRPSTRFAGPFTGDESPPGRPARPPPLLFTSCCAKRSTPNPRVTYSYSDLTRLQVYTCIAPTNFDYLSKIIGCTCVHPCPILGPPLPCPAPKSSPVILRN